MEMKGAMGGLYKLTEWITRIAFSNILWVLCTSPFLFIVLTKFLMAVQTPDAHNEQLLSNWILGILSPFVLFPATAALFTVVRKWVMGNPDVPVFKTFFKGYKENYKQSMIGGFVYTLLFVIMYVDYTVYMTQLGDGFQLVGIVMLVLLIVLFVSLFNFFSMTVHYEMKTTQLLKNAVLLTLIRPFRVFSTLAGSAILVYIGTQMPVLFVFFLFCLMALFAFFNFYATFTKMQEQQEKMRQAEEEESETEQALLESMDNVKTEDKGSKPRNS
ncbi:MULTISPECIES: YesL family protein [Paenibacillus]|uniref:Integral membrane protein n=2 Tax=Paenibacillus lactis TaxID=228574 RepID=G4H964_9BACL|nr:MULTISPECIES: DUF624 domain-containing protein [Paenibacillus]EHB68399.1 protein of unknown function DUF624 [Paenibacillus lactis 154]MBP1894342.1 putative membrane protein YesL [Paenibacillus lactis]MCM3497034.1 DUF624 domain-containing protein [Paenibacillus lactis]GIO91177.1 hypothetical protein J31TS3_24040 [Paenibacillus lactis]HAF99485.1 DUF624 domain-containing protein [Paenibacillus lactis]